jgi:cobalt-zinc-cadmium efflux system outer membrane protein
MKKHQSWRTVVAASCLALGACASFTAKPIAPEATARAFEARSLDSPEVQSYVASHSNARAPLAIRSWDLESLTLAAFYYSPELDVARAKDATAQAAVKTAGQRPNPTLQIPFGYTTNAKPGESPYTLGLGLDIPLETAGKRSYRTEHARQLSLAARLEVGNVAWQVRSRLRTQLLKLFVARKQSEILEKQLALRQQVVQMLEMRLDLGAASVPEVSQARTMLARDRLDLVSARQQAREALAGAAAGIGLPASALSQVDIRLDSFETVYPELPEDTARAQAVLNRADVLIALAGYEASQAALQLEIANQYPDIHIGPGYTYDAGARKFAMSLSGIQLPLSNRNEGPIAEAEARRAEAAARFKAVQARASGETALAAQNYHASLADLRLAQDLMATQERQLGALRKLFQAGETDRLGMAMAEHDLLAGMKAHGDAVAQVARSAGELEDAMQRPLSTVSAPAAR